MGTTNFPSYPLWASCGPDDVINLHGSNVSIAHTCASRICVSYLHPFSFKDVHRLSMEEANDIGQRIRKLRTDLGMKQADFVAALDISRSYLSKIESGTEQPGRELLLKIAQEYNLTFDWLLSGVGNRTPLYPLNDQEIQLLQAFRALPREEAETHLKLMLQRSGSKIG